MLFLLNDHVLDLGDPAETLRESGVADPSRLPRLAALVAMGQDAAYASDNFAAGHPVMARALAAQLALSSEANCALFVRPPRARSPRDVGVQFARAPLTTIVFLYTAQSRGQLTAAMINNEVWSLARAGAPA